MFSEYMAVGIGYPSEKDIAFFREFINLNEGAFTNVSEWLASLLSICSCSRSMTSCTIFLGLCFIFLVYLC